MAKKAHVAETSHFEYHTLVCGAVAPCPVVLGAAVARVELLDGSVLLCACAQECQRGQVLPHVFLVDPRAQLRVMT